MNRVFDIAVPATARQDELEDFKAPLDCAVTKSPCNWLWPDEGAEPGHINDPVRKQSSRLSIGILALVDSVAVALILQGCATTGPGQSLTVHEEPSPQQDENKHNTISIGTYNLEGLADPEGLALTLGALTNIHVWAFQEVILQEGASGSIVPLEQSTAPEQLRDILPGEPWHIYYVPVNPVGGGAWEGQAIASRYPLAKLEVWKLRSKGETKGKKRRAALACKVLTPNANILVVNTDHEVGISSIGPADRQLQVEDLLIKIRQNSQTNPLVLLGDFNTIGKPLQFWRRTSRNEIRRLQESLRAASLDRLPKSEVPYRTCRMLCFSYALDHIFLRNAHSCGWGSTTHRTGSDHKPLWTAIRTNQ